MRASRACRMMEVITLSSSPPRNDFIATTPPLFKPASTPLISSPLPSPSRFILRPKALTTSKEKENLLLIETVPGFQKASELLLGSRSVPRISPIKLDERQKHTGITDRHFSTRSCAKEDYVWDILADGTAAAHRPRSKAVTSRNAQSGGVRPDGIRKRGARSKNVKPDNLEQAEEEGNHSHNDNGVKGEKLAVDQDARNSENRQCDVNPRSEKEKTEVIVKTQLSNEPLGLEKAVARRRDWTPTKDSGYFEISEPAVPVELKSLPPSPSYQPPPEPAFKAMIGDFSCEPGHRPTSLVPRLANGEGATKRRKIETIDGLRGPPPVPQSAVKSSRSPKAPSKKPQTITELATKEFRKEDPSPSGTIRDYLLAPSDNSLVNVEDILAGLDDSIVLDKKLRKHMEKARARAGKRNPCVLPPEKAIKATESQDLLFGTASQLIREESPTLIREVQKAIHESESFKDIDALPNAQSAERGSLLGLTASSSLMKWTARRNIWAQAARDESGSLVEPEVIGLGGSSNNNIDVPCDLGLEGEPFLPISDIVESEPDASKTAVSERLNSKKQKEQLMVRSIAEAKLKSRKTRPPGKTKSKKGRREAAECEMPNYNAYTAAQLSKMVVEYGFKPIKRKGDMVNLLERCWKDQNRKAAEELDLGKDASEASDAQPRKSSSPKKRGRPKNSTESAGQEIRDVPSPENAPSRQVDADRDNRPRPSLNDLITSAIMAEAPSHDPKKLSWREKMLLYDPVIIEELSEWLNNGALKCLPGGVGAGWQASPVEIRDWCKANSICCLWKESLRGGTRKRY